MHGTGKAVQRQPLRHRIGLGEGAIDLLGLGGQDAVQPDGAGHGCFLSERGDNNRRAGRTCHANFDQMMGGD